MKPRRSYHQFCGLAKALDLLGERWTLLIVRNLLLGGRRYSDLLQELPGITTNLLAARLKEMERRQLIRREELPPPAHTTVYELTDEGAALEPVIMELARWGGGYLDPASKRDHRNLGWALLSLKRRYRGGRRCVVHFNVDGRIYELSLEDAYLRVSDRAVRLPGVTVHTSAAALMRWVGALASASELEADGEMRVEGSRQAWREVQHAWLPPAAAFARRERYVAS